VEGNGGSGLFDVLSRHFFREELKKTTKNLSSSSVSRHIPNLCLAFSLQPTHVVPANSNHIFLSDQVTADEFNKIRTANF
jgi:hypothetical protein